MGDTHSIAPAADLLEINREKQTQRSGIGRATAAKKSREEAQTSGFKGQQDAAETECKVEHRLFPFSRLLVSCHG